MDEKAKFRLAKLLGLLGSDHDGEILAAAKAIRRELEGQGKSFADLVSLVTGSALPALSAQTQLGLMVKSILRNENMMGEYEIRFVKDIAMRAELGRNYKLTDKQGKWFASLYAKYGERD